MLLVPGGDLGWQWAALRNTPAECAKHGGHRIKLRLNVLDAAPSLVIIALRIHPIRTAARHFNAPIANNPPARLTRPGGSSTAPFPPPIHRSHTPQWQCGPLVSISREAYRGIPACTRAG